jgi:hypothetical protein
LVDLEIAFDTAGVTPLESGEIQPGIACRTKRGFLSDRYVHVVFLKRLIGIITRGLLITAVVEQNTVPGRAKEIR